ncbi:DNA-3-methyladenine glycosylase I [Saccharospirillum sp. MSK14-1]|uniref:DNA-3-methyladenine glycosylase I n=1 Tax=Saccharospirillum sp. MSK14-1 TaxID=1897632 RepID=UPI000D3C101C|nr:DNA-3-methyladenine glycosylase I [Saccharospirillum sp. MSK14-1]PTY38899.1 DNA-3-methyladenine glycosylase I [Saccharospirillum sp. MSK14-1]
MTAIHDEYRRCGWCSGDALYQAYHDRVWGRPVRDSRELFAKLCLDGQQAGLSWLTILKKQDNYYRAFADFDPEAIAAFSDEDLAERLTDPGIVRNRLKVESIRRNARAYLAMMDAGEDFAVFLWSFVGGQPIINRWQRLDQIPVSTDEAQAMSKALKKRGFNFVGPTICYAFMQATGLVMDHLTDCHCFEACDAEARAFAPVVAKS